MGAEPQKKRASPDVSRDAVYAESHQVAPCAAIGGATTSRSDDCGAELFFHAGSGGLRFASQIRVRKETLSVHLGAGPR